MVFGEVVDGKGIIRKLEDLKTQNEKPIKEATITGMLAKRFVVMKSLLKGCRLRPAFRPRKDWRENC